MYEFEAAPCFACFCAQLPVIAAACLLHLHALATPGCPACAVPHVSFSLSLQPELPQQCSPSAARCAAKAHPDRILQLSRQQQLVPLLSYCLQDLDLSTGPNGAWLQQVVGLRLLPLADGQGLAAFEAPEQASKPQQLVFVVTDAVEQALVHTERKSRGCAGSLAQCRAGWQCPCDTAASTTQRCLSCMPVTVNIYLLPEVHSSHPAACAGMLCRRTPARHGACWPSPHHPAVTAG